MQKTHCARGEVESGDPRTRPREPASQKARHQPSSQPDLPQGLLRMEGGTEQASFSLTKADWHFWYDTDANSTQWRSLQITGGMREVGQGWREGRQHADHLNPTRIPLRVHTYVYPLLIPLFPLQGVCEDRHRRYNTNTLLNLTQRTHCLTHIFFTLCRGGKVSREGVGMTEGQPDHGCRSGRERRERERWRRRLGKSTTVLGTWVVKGWRKESKGCGNIFLYTFWLLQGRYAAFLLISSVIWRRCRGSKEKCTNNVILFYSFAQIMLICFTRLSFLLVNKCGQGDGSGEKKRSLILHSQNICYREFFG